jgi:putative spermidine/putrescine transport system permease protein
MSPLMVPPVVLGIAFLRFFTQIGLSGTFAGLVLSHVIIVTPFALRLVLASSYGIDRRIEDAAVSLGAGAATVFRRVTLPLILPGAVSGLMLAFITSFDEVTMTVFVASPRTETLPVRLFLYIQDNIDPMVASISACLIAMTVVAMVVLDLAYGLDRLFVGAQRS